jgi:RimJ/RimL family protein N-acetyltransferase
LTQSPIGEPLSEALLSLREVLPLKPDGVTLAGKFVRLEPVDVDRDAAELFLVSNGEPARLGEREIEAYDVDALVWRYLPYGPFTDKQDLATYLSQVANTPDTLALCVFDTASNRQVGITTFCSNDPPNLKIEVGHIWFSPLVQRTSANLESAYLMLKHAFGLGYRRLEWKCDALNERSRHSALRIGFKFEGIQEAHRITKGRNRDTAWYRILDTEWPAVRMRLEEMLYG